MTFQGQTKEPMSQYETEVTEGLSPLGGVNDPDVPVTVVNVSFEPGVRNGTKALTRNHDRLVRPISLLRLARWNGWNQQKMLYTRKYINRSKNGKS